VLLIPADSTSPAAAGVVEACRSYETAAERLRAIGRDRAHPALAFFALVDQGESVVSFLSGAMTVSIQMEGSRLEFDSTDQQGWLEENLRGKLRALTVAEKELRAGSQPLGDLLQGVVSGGGLELLDRAAAPAVREAPDQTVMMPRPKSALSEAEAGIAKAPGSDKYVRTSVVAGLPAAPAGEAVMIEGRECASGHLNDPLAPACRVCGGPLLDTVSKGPRPPLGRLVAKDGASFVVDRDYVIGRKPEQAPEVAAGVYAPLVVPSDESGVSRIHCDIRISQWSVLLTDRKSANGTFIRPVGVQEWVRLEPGHTVQVVPGSGISIGPYELRFEA